jgi:hypothetical protein
VSGSLERFVEQLCELELDPELLRTDPRGERWLPASMRQLIDDDPACARELDEFVAMELALYDVHEPADVSSRRSAADAVFFTHRVMEQLPEIEAVDDRRRTWILASAYALSIGVAYLLLGPLFSSGLSSGLSSGELANFVELMHDWYQGRALEAGGMWISLVLLVTGGALTLAPTGRHRADA